MNTASLRRRGYSKKEDIVLPAGYTLGDYWDIASTVYIKLSAKYNIDIEVAVTPDISNGFKNIIGPSGYFLWGVQNDKAAKFPNTTTDSAFFSQDTVSIITGHLAQGTDACTYYVNDNNTGLVGSVNSNTLNVFSYNGSSYNYRGRCYYIKIYDSLGLYKHYVPCVDSQGNGCMYEVVEGTFITPNSGTLVVK